METRRAWDRHSQPRTRLTTDAAEGAELFGEAGCAQCHVAAGQATGGKIGPDLNDVLTRWKGDRAGVLTEILEPGEKVDEKYRLQLLQLANGSTLTGLVKVTVAPSAVAKTRTSWLVATLSSPISNAAPGVLSCRPNSATCASPR